MQSAFSGIEMGKRSLVAHNQALNTTGHNLTNASTEGYSRQRVRMNAMHPLYDPGLNRENTPGQIGQGVGVETVERIHDEILERRIVAQGHHASYWQTRDKYILMTEQVYNEPEEISVRNTMDQFWESWQELSVHPEHMSSRQAVLQRGEAMLDSIHNRYENLKNIRTMVNDDVAVTVGEINQHLADIRDLNEQIVKVQAVGDNPNDLLDQRDLLVEKLSGLVNITVDNRDPDEFLVHTGGRHLIQGKQVQFLSTESDSDNEGLHQVVWDSNQEEFFPGGGKLAALVEVRDEDVKQEIGKLDLMTLSFADLVNEIHSQGSRMDGQSAENFFTEIPFVNNLAGRYDQDGDGVFDSTYIHRITGNNSLNPKDQIGIQGQITLAGKEENITIDYFPADTVEAVVDRINHAGAEVVARLDFQGRLSLKGTPAESTANPDFVLRYVEDSGNFLTGYTGLLQQSGPEGAFSWDNPDAAETALQIDPRQYSVSPLGHPAGWLEINSALKQDPSGIAAGFQVNGKAAPEGKGDLALNIASLRHQAVMLGNTRSFEDFFADSVAELGLKGSVAEQSSEAHAYIMKDLHDTKASLSGVNMDEEFSNMIQFQHGYAASARFVSEVDKMLDTIINRMGV